MYRTYAKMDISGSKKHDDHSGDPPTLDTHFLGLLSINFKQNLPRKVKLKCLSSKKS